MNMDLKFNSIKSYSKSYNPSDERKLVEIYNQNFDGFDIGCAINFLENKSLYEVYLFVGIGKDESASNLLPLLVDEKEKATHYFNKLKGYVDSGDLDLVIKLCEEESNK